MKILLLAVLIAGCFYGCEEIKSYPEIPTVKYVPPFGIDTATDDLGNEIVIGKLKFDFTDGDGDLGLEQPESDTLADSLIYNLYLNVFEKNDTGFAYVEDISNLNFRIPYIEREGQNKTLIGTVTIDLEYKTFEYDTIFYTFYIVDRQMNRSNVDSTEVLVFTEFKE